MRYDMIPLEWIFLDVVWSVDARRPWQWAAASCSLLGQQQGGGESEPRGMRTAC